MSRHGEAIAVVTLAALSAILGGCAFGEPNVRARPDGATPSDAGADGGFRPDGGPRPDAGAPPDAGRVDAGRPDAGPPDAGCAAETCDGTDEDCDGTIDEAAGCPCDVVNRDGHAYLLCPGPATWAAAGLSCEASGYALAVIEDAAEDAFVYGEIDARGFADTWLGHNDVVAEGSWVWLAGIPMIYTHWDAGEPNDSGGEDCGVVMTRSGRETEWDDRDCGDTAPYVCETPAP